MWNSKKVNAVAMFHAVVKVYKGSLVVCVSILKSPLNGCFTFCEQNVLIMFDVPGVRRDAINKLQYPSTPAEASITQTTDATMKGGKTYLMHLKQTASDQFLLCVSNRELVDLF